MSGKHSIVNETLLRAGLLALTGYTAACGTQSDDAAPQWREQATVQERLNCLRADLNGDLTVNSADIVTMMTRGYEVECEDCVEDLNRDGRIDSGDLVFLSQVGYETQCSPWVFESAAELGDFVVVEWAEAAQALQIPLDAHDDLAMSGGRVLDDLTPELGVPIKHANGIVDVPAGTDERIDEWASRWGQEGQQGRMRQVEAMILAGLFDETDEVHLGLAKDLLAMADSPAEGADQEVAAADNEFRGLIPLEEMIDNMGEQQACEVTCHYERISGGREDAEWDPGTSYTNEACLEPPQENPDFLGAVTSQDSIHELAGYCSGHGGVEAAVLGCRKTAYLRPVCTWRELQPGACEDKWSEDPAGPVACSLRMSTSTGLSHFWGEIYTDGDAANAKFDLRASGAAELSGEAQAFGQLTGAPSWQSNNPGDSDEPWELFFDTGIVHGEVQQGSDGYSDILLKLITPSCSGEVSSDKDDKTKRRKKGMKCSWNGIEDSIGALLSVLGDEFFGEQEIRFNVGSTSISSGATFLATYDNRRPRRVYNSAEVRLSALGDNRMEANGDGAWFDNYASAQTGVEVYARASATNVLPFNAVNGFLGCRLKRSSRYAQTPPAGIVINNEAFEFRTEHFRPSSTIVDARCGRGALGIWDPPHEGGNEVPPVTDDDPGNPGSPG